MQVSMSDIRGPDEERLLDRLGDTGTDQPQQGEGAGGADLEESYVSPTHEESESSAPQGEPRRDD